MLISFHSPISDVRGFFSDELGRVGRRADAQSPYNPSAENQFIRSVGLPVERWLGLGNEILNEECFYSLHNRLTLSIPKPQRLPPLRISNSRSLKRFYQLDETCGRFEISIPINSKNLDNFRSTTLDQIFQALEPAYLNIKLPHENLPGNLNERQSAFANFFQNRTTSERRLKSKNYHQAVFAAPPTVFVELGHDEIRKSDNLFDIAAIDVPGVNLGFRYFGHKIPSWIISRIDDSSASRRNARLLRMYLSRLTIQFGCYRTIVRKLPSVVNHYGPDGLEQFVPEQYSYFLRSNNRFISKLLKRLKENSGAEFAIAARYAHEMIDREDVTKILKQHKEIISRGNIFQQLENDVRFEADCEEYFEKETARSKQSIIAILSKVVRVNQSMDSVVHIPRARIVAAEIRSKLPMLATHFSIYGSLISSSRQDHAAKVLSELETIASKKNINGPLFASKLDLLEKLFSPNQAGGEQLREVVEDLKSLALA